MPLLPLKPPEFSAILQLLFEQIGLFKGRVSPFRRVFETGSFRFHRLVRNPTFSHGLFGGRVVVSGDHLCNFPFYPRPSVFLLGGLQLFDSGGIDPIRQFWTFSNPALGPRNPRVLLSMASHRGFVHISTSTCTIWSEWILTPPVRNRLPSKNPALQFPCIFGPHIRFCLRFPGIPSGPGLVVLCPQLWSFLNFQIFAISPGIS